MSHHCSSLSFPSTKGTKMLLYEHPEICASKHSGKEPEAAATPQLCLRLPLPAGVLPEDTHLPDAGLLPVHHRHAAHFVGLDELPLRLVELLRHEAHEGIVGGVSCGHQGEKTRGCTDVFGDLIRVEDAASLQHGG